jgi:hypothetical protein
MKKIIFAMILTLLTGCVNKKIIYEKETLVDGIIKETTTTTIDGWFLGDKTVASANSVSVVKIETTGGTTTMTFLPNIIFGTATGVFGTTPVDDDRPMFGFSQNYSGFMANFNTNARNVSWFYIGKRGETASQTEKRINALSNINKNELTNDISTDSNISE